MKYAIHFSLVFIFVLSCNSVKNTIGTANSSYEILHESEYGGKEEKSYEVLKTKAEFIQETSDMVFDETTQGKLNSVDFSTSYVVALHSGMKTTGGYTITVNNVEVNGDTTTVHVLEKGPRPGEMVTMALTNPFSLVVIDKNTNVIFK